ncbi:MAG: pyruvate:ferredoxin (flavodoxin) oxidoreductase [Acidobacteriota bacterium]|nr:MAG: pyruvate:ferredoxin (flavodoxin) oxidoreductase [Acidobacteriota bacterium]
MAAKRNKVMTVDGNEAAAYVAYRVNEVCAIYPITPSSPMAELADEWSAKGVTNIWGNRPEVIEMQSEGGAAGAVHGALQAGSLTTTFTASQGLMLMIPNMYKIAGELTPTVFHVAARSLSAQALSIFGDHQDVMAARTTGFALLASSSVQEAHDLALVAQAATLRSRIPFIHFFDGFRTSHEVSKIDVIPDETIRAMIDDRLVLAHRARALNPDNPFIRGTAQNPDVYFQGRETVNPFYSAVPGILKEEMGRFAELTGRDYLPVTHFGAADAERVIVIIGSGAETAIETAEFLCGKGEKTGVVKISLCRPFPVDDLLKSVPESVTKIAVLDRTKEPGATGEPLYQDVAVAFAEAFSSGRLKTMPCIVGGRYGLSSKEFTPAMVNAVFENLSEDEPKNHFTAGITDDVGGTSLEVDGSFRLDDPGWTEALFFGLGADGTVGANKNSIKIIGENTDLYAQGYFVYDSKKSGAKTVSHLRFGKAPVRAPYLIASADFVACHQYNFVEKEEMLGFAKTGATFLLNTSHDPEEVWGKLPGRVQEHILEKGLKFFVIDAARVARETGMAGRINTIMQTCFFALSGVLPRDEAIAEIKKAIEKTYSKKGRPVVEKNFEAVDRTLENLFEVNVPAAVTAGTRQDTGIPESAPDFVRNVTRMMIEGRGDAIPVGAMPVDGTFPSGTAKFEKRNVADRAAVWEPDICIQCGNCGFVCPHSVIRSKFYHSENLEGAPEGFKSAPINARGFPETKYSLQVYVEDCTACNLCYDVCPVTDRSGGGRAINVLRKPEDLSNEREKLAFFESLPNITRSEVNFSTVHGVQFLEPYFEFSGACAGCGETPYIKVMTQLFGDRLVVANATGCSSIYGGNLPTTPWTKDVEGRGPAWSNSLFEDNAEFGLGMRLSADKQLAVALDLLEKMKPDLGAELADALAGSPQELESEIVEQRVRVAALKTKLAEIGSDDAMLLLSLADQLVRRSVWIVGGDGWAYDIGSAGLDHVLASGRNVNVLVLDTEVYSNTGGQMSKATPTAASAKFAAAGKRVGKKDLALQAISYGTVYVAQVAMGANPQQTLLAMREAEAYDGPSLVLAYSHCIAHGINMEKGLRQQKLAVDCGYWPLIRYNPVLRREGLTPFVLDSTRPSIPLRDYAYNELRYKMLTQTDPVEAEKLMKLAQELVDLRWKTYEEMAGYGAGSFAPVALP